MKKLWVSFLCLCLTLQVAVLPVSAKDNIAFEVYTIEEEEPSEYGYIERKRFDETGEELNFEDTENDLELEEPQLHSSSSSVIPSAYDLRDYDYVSPVTSQGSSGTCWAFACVSSLESNSIMSGVSDYDDTDFSEAHLIWFSKNTKSTDINDHNYDEGKVVENPYSGSECGGNSDYVTTALARWSGLAKESDYRFYPYSHSQMGNYDESVRYDKNSGVVMKSAEDLADATAVKQWIMENGAVTAAYYSDKQLYSEPYYAYNYTESRSSSHMISIVGWDDNYPVENFLVGYTPQENGAWLCKNSWGEDWGLNGYFWISYEDKTLHDFVGFTTQKADDFTNNYTYNGNGCPTSRGGGAAPIMANVFTAKNYEIISDVAAYVLQPNTRLTISIYKDLIENYTNPTEGTLVTTWQTTIERSGYHTIDVPENVFLEPGTTFSVLIQLHNDKENPKIACERGTKNVNTINPGESFVYNGTKWIDMYDLKSNILAASGNVSVQALTKCVPEHESQVYMNFKDNLIITPHNDFEQLKEKSGIFSNSVYSIKDTNKNDISYLTTGSTLTVTPNDGQATDFTVVVEGDTNGDGVCDVLDASEAELITNGHKYAEPLQCYAANGFVKDDIDISAYQNVVNKALEF